MKRQERGWLISYSALTSMLLQGQTEKGRELYDIINLLLGRLRENAAVLSSGV